MFKGVGNYLYQHLPVLCPYTTIITSGINDFSIAMSMCPHYLADLAPAWRACSMLTWRWRLLRFLLRLSTSGGLASLLLQPGRGEAWLFSFSVTRSSPWLGVGVALPW